MANCNIPATATLFLSICIVLQGASSQKCIPGVKKLDITEEGYRSPIVIKARVTAPSKVNHTADVTYLFPTKTGGLSKGDTIIFGPVKKGKGCPRMKKGTEYLLFLEEKAPGSNFYKIKYDPTNAKHAKKLRKILCKGCVKEPKFKKRDKVVEVVEDKPFSFNCKVSGNPKPTAAFYKDSVELKNGKILKIKIKKKGGGGKLKISKVKSTHAGVYTCRAENFAGNATLSYTLTVKEACIRCTDQRYRSYCLYGGKCCFLPERNEAYCRCEPNYKGKRCDEKFLPDMVGFNKENSVEARYHRQTVAIMAVCIALLIVVLVCYIVYCKFKKSRSHILKDIQKQYCHANGRSNREEESRPITGASGNGILGDEPDENEPELTGYSSTNLTEPSTFAPKPIAFSQRPQTYDDVIPLGSAAGESQPLVARPHHTEYAQREEAKHVNGKRKRKNGVAYERRGQRKPSNNDTDGDSSSKPDRRVDELKRSRDSIISTTSSVGSHPELRKPAIPIDERLAAMSSLHVPPSYGDIPDSRQREEQGFHPSTPSTSEQPHTFPFPVGAEEPRTSQMQDHAISSPSSVSRLTEVDSDGKTEEDAQNVRPSTQSSSPTFSSDYLPKHDQNSKTPSLASQDMGSGHMSPRSKLKYKEAPPFPTQYPYYEQSHENRLHSPSYHNNGRSPLVTDQPGTFYDVQRRSQPSSPRQFHPNPRMGMPFHHAPITVASAVTHQLSLLTKEQSDLNHDSNRFTPGSQSSSSSDVSEDTGRNRDSHKIEV